MSSHSSEPTARKIQHYGWLRDLPDARDHIFTVDEAKFSLTLLPPSVDMRTQCPPIYDQGQLGSCTANAAAGLDEFQQMKQGKSAVTPSRLFIYFFERVIEGTVSSDSGASIRDSVKVLANRGAPPESEWPYDISKFTVRPPMTVRTDAQAERAIAYARVTQTLAEMQKCLASGHPFIFGFTVYSSFESAAVASTGIVPMPKPTEKILGGHAVMAVGYDDATRRFKIRNSWGASWGQAGYCEMPYEYLSSASYCSDFWTITQMTGP